MTAPTPETLTWLTLVAGPDTQPNHTQFAGRIVGVPAGTDLGSGPTSPGRVFGVYGYPRPAQNPESVTALEWVLSSSLPAAAKAFIDGLPATGWLDADARTSYETIGRALIERGIPMADVGTVVRTLHDAAVANADAAP